MTNPYGRLNGHINKSNDAGIAVLVLLFVFIVLLPIAVALSALITLGAWNLGVVAIVAACGSHVATISFWTAIFANFAIGIVGRIFRPRAEAKASA